VTFRCTRFISFQCCYSVNQK